MSDHLGVVILAAEDVDVRRVRKVAKCPEMSDVSMSWVIE